MTRVESAAMPEPALRMLVAASPDILVLLQPDGRCRHVSSASLNLLGYAPAGLSGLDLRDLVLDDDRHTVGDLLDRLGAGASNAAVSVRVRRSDGGWLWMEANARRVPAGAGAVLALRDITVRKQAEAVLEEANVVLRRRAIEDPETGLANRGHFLATVERELRRARRDGAGLTLIVAELDRFGLFVDLYGHDAAENAVRRIATCAEEVLQRPGDVAGRLSSAAIGILLPGTDDNGAGEVVNRLTDGVRCLLVDHAGSPDGLLTINIGLVRSSSATQAAELVDMAERQARASKPTD